jgi:mono/diheme cytochrome c family protein
MRGRWIIRLILLTILPGGIAFSTAAEPTSHQKASHAHPGYLHLTSKAYVPPDFDTETFDHLWQNWPLPDRSAAEKATPAERRRMTLARYGLTGRPDDPQQPLQYVVSDTSSGKGQWSVNCFSCHGGTVPDGQGGSIPWPGAPNSRLALQTLVDDVIQTKASLGRAISLKDLGSSVIPLGTNDGTTNAVMFGVVLLGIRNHELAFDRSRGLPEMTHHDMDAPPWWHFKRKKMLYIDGFAAKGHRGLMQFMLVRENGPERFRQWEPEFREVYDYLISIEAPKYPYPIDRELAAVGERAYSRVCAECHGTYGAAGDSASAEYPERLVPIEEIKTDRVRLDALQPKHRKHYGESWFAEYGKLPNVDDPGGYVAPPLDGVWASAPYLHNGSVPTLWHMLHSAERPVVWRREGDAFDPERVGPRITTFEQLPASVTESWQKRQHFDTRAFGKSAAGHDFPDQLSVDEKRAMLEYLKTL